MFGNQLRFTGMTSGMDTHSIVQQMMRAESMRMDRLNRRRQLATWRQEEFRNISRQLDLFRMDHLSVAGRPNNVMRSTTFAAWEAVVSTTGAGTMPGGLAATAGNNATAGRFLVRMGADTPGQPGSGGAATRTTVVGGQNVNAFTPDGADPVRGTTLLSAIFDIPTIGADYRTFIASSSAPIAHTSTAVPDDWRDAGVWAQDGANFRTTTQRGLTLTANSDEGTHQLRRIEMNGTSQYVARVVRTAAALPQTDIDGNPISDPETGEYLYHAPEVTTHFYLAEAVYHDGVRTFVLQTDGGNLVPVPDVQTPGTPIPWGPDHPDYGYLNPGDAGYGEEFIPAPTPTPFNEETHWISPAAFTVHNYTHTLAPLRSTVSFGGRDVTVYANDTLNSFMNRVNSDAEIGVTMTFNQATGAFTLTSRSYGATDPVAITDPSGLMARLGLTAASPTAPTVTAGSHAHVYVISGGNQIRVGQHDSTDAIRFVDNGRQDTFIYNGVTVTLTGARAGDEFAVDTRRNVDNIFEAVRDFVEEYNRLVLMLHEAHRTARPRTTSGNVRSFFEPLTETERRDMSDREIEQWEAQARRGLLHRDSTIRDIQAQMRRQINEGVTLQDGTRVFLHQIGVTADGAVPGDRSTQNIGLLRIDEARLRSEIQANPERVGSLFRNHPGDFLSASEYDALAANPRERNLQLGLAHRLTDVINRAAGEGGSIARIAGTEVTPHGNRLARQIAAYDQRIDRMQEWLVRREAQLFRQFSMMEQAMARSHQQMDSLFMFSMN